MARNTKTTAVINEHFYFSSNASARNLSDLINSLLCLMIALIRAVFAKLLLIFCTNNNK